MGDFCGVFSGGADWREVSLRVRVAAGLRACRLRSRRLRARRATIKLWRDKHATYPAPHTLCQSHRPEACGYSIPKAGFLGIEYPNGGVRYCCLLPRCAMLCAQGSSLPSQGEAANPVCPVTACWRSRDRPSAFAKAIVRASRPARAPRPHRITPPTAPSVTKLVASLRGPANHILP